MTPTTSATIRVQGRNLSKQDLSDLQALIDGHPQWSRHRISVEICQSWDWRTPLGRVKTFAARSMLLKLEQEHGLRLPPICEHMRRTPWGLGSGAGQSIEPPGVSVECRLRDLQPLHWTVALHGTAHRQRALALLREYHYLGCNRPVGTNLIYLVQDRHGRDLAIHLVAAAA